MAQGVGRRAYGMPLHLRYGSLIDAWNAAHISENIFAISLVSDDAVRRRQRWPCIYFASFLFIRLTQIGGFTR